MSALWALTTIERPVIPFFQIFQATRATKESNPFLDVLATIFQDYSHHDQKHFWF
jgi:hypothetical protein